MYGDFRDRPARREGLGMWDIAAAVCIGVLAANAITWGVAELRVRWELHQMAQATREAVRRIESEAAGAAAAQREALQADRRRRAAQEHAEDAARRAVLAEKERKAAAWAKFYRPSKGCVESTVSVECANEHVRAKSEFERRYGAGEL